MVHKKITSKKYGDFVPLVFIEILSRICSPLFFLSPSDEISPPRKEKKRKKEKKNTAETSLTEFTF
jgi:hypothetical protein